MPLHTRREFAKLALAAIPAAGIFSLQSRLPAAEPGGAPAPAGRPDSTVRGVSIGLNVPYNYGNNNMSAEETLERTVRLGVSALELRSQPIEGFMGAPARGRGGRGGGEELRQWRATAAIARAADLRRMYESAGVRIEIVKFDGVPQMSDEELDFAFTLARNVGARAISCEMAVEQAGRVGAAAERHRMFVGWHNHAALTTDVWEQAFAAGRYNVDIGHFIAGNNTSPLPFIERHHERVMHIHVKDRRFNNGPNVPFGQGDTPIVEILRAIRDNGWPIQATIEFEYPVPEGSDRMAEIARSVQFCRDALA
jgi:sugar phosphate isomerase/epimerase